MSSVRDLLTEELQQYICDTYRDLCSVQVFILHSSLEWIKAREAEVQAMNESKESEKELSEVLEKTRSGLKQVRHHLQAMENLAVTSVHVFESHLDPEVDLKTVSLLIATAQILAPFLLVFSQDDDEFFQPVLLNRSIYQAQLQKYTAATMCLVDGWKSNNVLAKFNDSKQPKVRLPDLTEDRVWNMLAHIRALTALRSNQAFKLSVLFRSRSQSFVTAVRESRPQLEQWLKELEGCAEKLDSMNKGARISGVVASVEGIVGGGLSIAGLIFAPPTLGLSLILDVVGLSLGLVSGIQTTVTAVVENKVNSAQELKAKEDLERCVQLINKLQILVNDVIHDHMEALSRGSSDVAQILLEGAVPVANDVSGLGSIIYDNIANNRLTSEELRRVTEGEEALARVELRGLRMAKMARVGTSVLNGLLVLADGYFLYQDAHALTQGTETELSHWIRARSALWRVEVEAFQKCHDSLCEAQKDYKTNQEELQKDFYQTLSR